MHPIGLGYYVIVKAKMTESDPKITFEQTPTRTNDEDMSNTVHQDISDCSNSIPVDFFLNCSKEGVLLRNSSSVLRLDIL
jgi:hypothetical protein